jgi:hypothetical protein
MERFRHLIKYTVLVNGCWSHNSTPTKAGYGRLTYEGIRDYAHRIAYRLSKGEIPNGLFVCHSCDFPACVNPDHLFLGTQKDNMGDAKSKNRISPPPIHKGESHHLAYLSDEEIEDIRGFLSLGIPQNKVAKMCGTTNDMVSRIANNKTRRVK